MGPSQYQQFVGEGIKNSTDPFKKVYAGFLLGSGTFIKDKLRDLGQQVEGDEVTYKQIINRQISKEDIIKALTDKYHTTIEQIRVSKRRPMKEKMLMLYLLNTNTGLTKKEIGLELGMKPAAVSKAVFRIRQRMRQDGSLQREIDEVMSNVRV